MNLKINSLYQTIYILAFSLFLFFWGMDLEPVVYHYIRPDHKYFYLSDIKLSYAILFLLIPIFYSYVRKKVSSIKEIFNFQQYIMIFILFVVVHFLIVKIYYHEIIDKAELANILYLILLSLIFCHYRNFIATNLKNIITFYLLVFVLYSIYEGSEMGSQLYNIGQCNNDIYIISVIQDFFKITLTNSIYRENSHLAMMTIAIFFASLYILVKEKKDTIYFIFLSLFAIEVIIVLNNLSTTYFVGYFCSLVILLLFFFKKFNLKFWLIAFLFLCINSYLFFSDKHCVMKIADFKIKNIQENSLAPTPANLTTKVYERSIILSKNTLINYPLGWGIDGMDNATKNLLKNYNNKVKKTDKNTAFWKLKKLNLKDGLSNFFKMFTEFGFFAFIILFFFIKYILNIKNINTYNIFIIVLFVTLCIRGAGYFNGGFIFCLFEFFYYKKVTHEVKIEKKTI